MYFSKLSVSEYYVIQLKQMGGISCYSNLKVQSPKKIYGIYNLLQK